MESEAVCDEAMQQLPMALRRLITFEQKNLWKLDRACGRVEGAFDRRYLPEGSAVFNVPYLKFKRRELYVHRESEWCNGILGLDADSPDGEVLFPFHPAEFEQHRKLACRLQPYRIREDALHLIGTPTSSVRTLLVWPDGQPRRAFFAKLSLRSRFLGDRRLTRRKVAASVGLSQFVLGCGSELPPGIRYFPEPVGLVPRQLPDCGVIVRSVPDDIMDGRVVVAPLFALMGGSNAHPPLILQLMERRTGSAKELLEEVLLAKFAKIWIDLVFDFGLILEAHGQDVLLTLSPDLAPLGTFYYRDFEGLAVDWTLRRARGLRDADSLPHAFEWFSTYETWGYPRFQMVSTKIWMSLTDFLDLVLGELELALLTWQSRGAIGKERFKEGELTLLFSRYLRSAIQEKVGLREVADYDIRHQRNRFVKFLMEVRREIVGSSR